MVVLRLPSPFRVRRRRTEFFFLDFSWIFPAQYVRAGSSTIHVTRIIATEITPRVSQSIACARGNSSSINHYPGACLKRYCFTYVRRLLSVYRVLFALAGASLASGRLGRDACLDTRTTRQCSSLRYYIVLFCLVFLDLHPPKQPCLTRV